VRIGLGNVYRDAWQVYRLLFRRSVATAAIVYALNVVIRVASDVANDPWADFALGLASFLFLLGGPVLVQGALVEMVRNIHEGRHPERIRTLYAEARLKFWSLLWASIVYGLGVIFGLILLITPGLLVAARWCLMAPLIMLEGPHGSTEIVGIGAAAYRPVLVIVVVTFLVTTTPTASPLFLPGGWASDYLLPFIWSSLTAPFSAHVLTVIYYRLTDPERPIVHEDVLRWSSVWEMA